MHCPFCPSVSTVRVACRPARWLARFKFLRQKITQYVKLPDPRLRLKGHGVIVLSTLEIGLIGRAADGRGVGQKLRIHRQYLNEVQTLYQVAQLSYVFGGQRCFLGEGFAALVLACSFQTGGAAFFMAFAGRIHIGFVQSGGFVHSRRAVLDLKIRQFVLRRFCIEDPASCMGGKRDEVIVEVIDRFDRNGQRLVARYPQRFSRSVLDA